jgi:hypothetical protein
MELHLAIEHSYPQGSQTAGRLLAARQQRCVSDQPERGRADHVVHELELPLVPVIWHQPGERLHHHHLVADGLRVRVRGGENTRDYYPLDYGIVSRQTTGIAFRSGIRGTTPPA